MRLLVACSCVASPPLVVDVVALGVCYVFVFERFVLSPCCLVGPARPSPRVESQKNSRHILTALVGSLGIIMSCLTPGYSAYVLFSISLLAD